MTVRREGHVTLKVGPGLAAEARAVAEFAEVHSGTGHSIVVANDTGRQTLACSCGMPGGRLPERQAVSAPLVEDDVNDG